MRLVQTNVVSGRRVLLSTNAPTRVRVLDLFCTLCYVWLADHGCCDSECACSAPRACVRLRVVREDVAHASAFHTIRLPTPQSHPRQGHDE
jgi:hypothetical protein